MTCVTHGRVRKPTNRLKVQKESTHPIPNDRAALVVWSAVSERTTCTDLSGPGWDRTSDLPRVKLKRCQERDLCAGQVGRTGPILGVQNMRYKRRGGCRADEIDP